MDAAVVALAALLGALIGSFSNVLVHRIPRRESVAFPPSHCPSCGHRLAPLDLVPVLSWLALRGRCRYCGAPISWRYPLLEASSAALYAGVAWRFPPLDNPVGTAALWFLCTALLVCAAIDLATRTLPDALTLPAVAVGVAAGLAGREGGPDAAGALHGALLGAGLLSLIGAYGAWVLRRFREPRFPEHPIGYMQVHLAALAGAWLGWPLGLAAGTASTILNLAARRAVRVPDALTLGGLALSLAGLAAGSGPGLIVGVQGALLAAGGTALLAGLYWAFRPDPAEDEEGDPVAMGFGDVKLAAAIGAFLGWEGLVVALAISVVLGAVVGLLARAAGGGRELPFGPFMAAGALVALFLGSAPLEAYLGTIGL